MFDFGIDFLNLLTLKKLTSTLKNIGCQPFIVKSISIDKLIILM